MSLSIGELVGFIRADDSGWNRGLDRAALRLRGLQRDADGTLRDLRGRFVSEGEAAGRGLSDGIRAHADLAAQAVKRVGPAIAAIGAGLPAVSAAVVAFGSLASGAAAAGLAVKAFQLASQPQLQAVTDVAELAAKAEEAAGEGGKKAAAAQKEYTDALKDLPPATRTTAKAFIGLKKDYKGWSDEMSGTTMPLFTKGIGILRDLLPMLTPFVKAAAGAIGKFLDDVARGVKSAGFKEWAADMSQAAGPALYRFLTVIKNLAIGFGGLLQAFLPSSAGVEGGLVRMSEAFAKWGTGLKDSQGFAEFLALAKQGAQMLGQLGAAALKLFVAVSPLIGVTSLVAMQLAGIVNALPPEVLKVLASAIAGVVIGMKAYRAGAAVVSAASTIMRSAALRTAAAWVASAARSTAAMLRIAASATANAARTAAVWAAAALRATATWLATMIRVAAVTVARFAMMAARAIAWAATMAAQWLIAMGPIGWIIITVIALVALIIAKWDLVKQYTLAAWNAVKAALSAAVDGILAAVGWLATIPGKVGAWFGRAKDAAVQKATAMVNYLKGVPGQAISALSSLGGRLWSTVSAAGGRMVSAISAKVNSAVNWVRGLPGRARSALGSLGSTLYASGRSLISGFISGITSKAGELYGKAKGLVSRVRNLFPFSPAKEGPFSGRGYTLYSGRALISGFAQGITQQQGAVTAAMARVAQAGQDALGGSVPALTVGQGGTAALTAPRAGAPGAGQAGGAAAPQQQPVVRVVVDASGGGDDLTRWLRKTVRVQGRGNVQVAFGGG